MSNVLKTTLALLSMAIITVGGAKNPIVSPQRVDIFVPSARYPCFRQPAIVAAGSDNSILLAFAENRNVSACAPAMGDEWKMINDLKSPEEVGSLQYRRSTDGGQTWSPMQSLYAGNIDFYMVTPDATGMKVVLLLQVRGAGNVIIESHDAGMTWSTEKTLVVSLPSPFSSIKPAVGHGIVIDKSKCAGGCAHAGRMVVPMVCTNGSVLNILGDKGACPSCNACLIYSDDSGSTWNFGGFGPAGSRESEVVQLTSTTADATMYMNARNMGATPGHRMTALCTMGGRDCSSYGIDTTLVAPNTPHWTGIVDGIVGVPPSSTSLSASVDRLVFIGASNPVLRANITMRSSSDGGISWSSPTEIWSGLGAYSDVAFIAKSNPHSVAILCENGENSFADRVSVFLAQI